MPETLDGTIEQKEIRNIKFEYDTIKGSLTINIHVTSGIVDMLSKNMAKPKERLTFPSLIFIDSSVSIFE